MEGKVKGVKTKLPFLLAGLPKSTDSRKINLMERQEGYFFFFFLPFFVLFKLWVDPVSHLFARLYT